MIPGLSWDNFFLKNLIPVTLANVLGGVLFVALAYRFVHLKGVVKEPQC